MVNKLALQIMALCCLTTGLLFTFAPMLGKPYDPFQTLFLFLGLIGFGIFNAQIIMLERIDKIETQKAHDILSKASHIN